MPTLAQQWIKEGEKIGEKRGEKIGEKRGELKAMRETARRMLLNNFSVEQVIAITGLTEKEINSLMN